MLFVNMFKNLLKQFNLNEISNANIDFESILNNASLRLNISLADLRLKLIKALNDTQNFETDTDKILFDLIAIHHFTYKNVAKQLCLSKKNVKKKYNLVLTRLLTYLHNKDIIRPEDYS